MRHNPLTVIRCRRGEGDILSTSADEAICQPFSDHGVKFGNKTTPDHHQGLTAQRPAPDQRQPVTAPAPLVAAGLIREWELGAARICAMDRPSAIPCRHWMRIMDDALLFLPPYGAEAMQMGWTTLDLFGVSGEAPWHRLDLMGLVPMIGGRTVVTLTERSARLKCTDATTQTFYRKPDQAGRVPLWELE